jgi:adenosine deaminase
MQTEVGLREVVVDLFSQLKRENVIYAEIRFAPLLHLKQGLSPETVVEIVAQAVRLESQATGIKAGLILSTLRHYTEAQSLKTVKLVERYGEDTTVCGFDIASDEAGFPIDAHVAAFQYAFNRGIPCTAHAGEAKGPESVWETLENFKPRRIGHGVRSIEDPRLVEHLAANNIHLEVCPTCNVQTNIYTTYADHPIDKLKQAGVSLGVNTDGRSLSEISLTQEYAKLEDTFGWGIEAFYQANVNALNHAFIPDEEKVAMREVLRAGYWLGEADR